MTGTVLSIVIAFLSGLLGSAQGSINSQIGKASGQYAMIIGVSLVQALLAGVFLLRTNGWGALTTVSSPWMIAAGILGTGIMFGVSFSIGSIGTLSVYVLVILGQIIASTLIDHYGLFSSPRLPVTPQKIGSIFIILLGVYCLIKSP